MMFESEVLSFNDLEIEKVYKKEQLDLYAEDHNCLLIEPDITEEICGIDDLFQYKVVQIFDNTKVTTEDKEVLRYSRVIVIKKR